MINVEWENALGIEECTACGRVEKDGHVAYIELNASSEPESGPESGLSLYLCANCVEELKRRLS